MLAPLESVVQEAWLAGKAIDLKGVQFGPSLRSWSEERFHDKAYPYYFFLAGLVRSQACNRILEIGTHFGGSGLSMRRGIGDPNQANLVTIDITDLNPALHNAPGLTKLTGDANSEAMIQKVLEQFSGQMIDLMYIDTRHSFMPTALALGVYGMLLRPRFVVLDDISLTDGMRQLWSRLRTSYEDAVNCIDVAPQVRVEKCGFGLLRLR
jgi:hypothetical protein